MSILCPACNGIGEVSYASPDDIVTATTCLTCAGKGSIGPSPLKTEWTYDATCERCGLGRRFSLPTPPERLNPVMIQLLAGPIGCPRAPRICGTLKLKEVKYED